MEVCIANFSKKFLFFHSSCSFWKVLFAVIVWNAATSLTLRKNRQKLRSKRSEYFLKTYYDGIEKRVIPKLEIPQPSVIINSLKLSWKSWNILSIVRYSVVWLEHTVISRSGDVFKPLYKAFPQKYHEKTTNFKRKFMT